MKGMCAFLRTGEERVAWVEWVGRSPHYANT